MTADAEGKYNVMRFREDLLAPLSERAETCYARRRGEIRFDLALNPEGPTGAIYYADL